MSAAGLIACALLFSTVFSQAPDAEAPATRSLRVTVVYQGAGAVDEAHRLFVQVFDTSYIGHEGVKPIVSRALAGNRQTAAFELTGSPVYVAVFYDRAGACSNDCAEAPSGAPAALYGAQAGQADPIEIPRGEERAISVSFDDSIVMP